MRSEFISLFLENNRAMEDVKGKWGTYDIQRKCNTLNITLRNKRLNANRVNIALEIIKNNTSVFSNFRGINKLTTAITISLEEDMETSLKEIISIYNSLKNEFYSSEYLILAAQVIFNSRDRIITYEAVKNTRKAYDCMKKYHRFLTSSDDVAIAAMIATTKYNIEETFEEIEKCYRYLKANKIAYSNNLQGLSNILALVDLGYEEKCNRVIDMYKSLKQNKVAIEDYYVPILGIVSFLADDNDAFAKKVIEVSEILKKEKGFGNFSLGKRARNMISVGLVSMEYIEELADDMKDRIINSTNNISLTVAIAMQTATIIALTAATSAASSSASGS